MADFNQAVTKTLIHEGGFFHNTKTGEVVNFGITAKFLAGHNLPSSEADVHGLTRESAVNLYRQFFWNPLHLAAMDDQELADKVFDLQVNTGQGARMLQQAINQSVSIRIAVDGALGPISIAGANSLDSVELLTRLREIATEHYREIAANNPALAPDLPEWLTRLAS